MINNNAIIYQYLRLALDINNNISSTIQLLNNLRFNVSTIIEQQQQQQQSTGSIPRRPLNIPIIEMSRNLSAKILARTSMAIIRMCELHPCDRTLSVAPVANAPPPHKLLDHVMLLHFEEPFLICERRRHTRLIMQHLVYYTLIYLQIF